MAKRNTEEFIHEMKLARDEKVREHLLQYAPIWLVEDTPKPENDSLQFKVIFNHSMYGWVSRRYVYDSFTDVLNHRGQMQIDEAETIEVQAQEPYLEAPDSNNVLSYGG
jgi:hypothetical protein